jgi:hypothetical protein
MQFLMFIESLSKVVTVDNVETVISLVDKLITLAESMEQSITLPPTTDSK